MSAKRKALARFGGGATRSKQDVRYDLIPSSAYRALGRRLTLGAARHGENNWKRGDEGFRKATISHLLAHLVDYLENGNRTEANTDAMLCNAAFLCEFEERAPFGVKTLDAAGVAGVKTK